MSLTTIIIFILFLGPLVFFHELGHFLFAKFFGVRVETFSIGFGPKILKWSRGHTTYAISLIPLGGYVKMFGDDPLKKEGIPEHQRAISFTHKTRWERFWIVFGGPMANFLLAVAIFWGLLIFGEKIPEVKLGVIEKKTALYSQGFRTGDVLHQINGLQIRNPSDLLENSQEGLLKVMVIRQGAPREFSVGMDGKRFFDEIVANPPLLLAPKLYDSQGKLWDIEGLEEGTSLEEFLETEGLTTITLSHMGLEQSLSLSPSVDRASRVEQLRQKGWWSTDLLVGQVMDGLPAKAKGIRKGDVIRRIGGQEIYSFSQIKEIIQSAPEGPISVEFIRDGRPQVAMVAPQQDEQNGKIVKLLGIYSGAIYQGPRFVKTAPLGPFEAVVPSLKRSWRAMEKTFDGFFMLLTGKISFRTVGGPITIGKVARSSYDISLSYFFQLMALFSINLGVINLFPIPVLDGGHLLFILIETINRGPISRRKMEIAQQVGLSIILLLMFGAIFNDFTR